MAQQQLSTDTEGMRAAGGHFGNTLTSLEAMRKSIDAEMGGLQAQWRGEASQKFTMAMQDWDRNAQIIARKLSDMQQAVQASNTTFTSAENIATGAAAGLPGM